MRERTSDHWSICKACNASFNLLCRRSTIPLQQGWYAVVLCLLVPSKVSISCPALGSNCVPWSITMTAGGQQLATQVLRKWRAVPSAVIAAMAVAVHHEVRSMQVRR
ncbi:hypothetical protein Pmani_002060 [Petrolisthes manimaculis]|uniref:Uncharacterized protein n=1 Tax=Petrolisthes manimaculis TaxID=1843537 RepID=A0AAE1QJF3_9EUCA|nr:hypothetical protein Pmani_002060 [Petrolisthes manimaculis]